MVIIAQSWDIIAKLNLTDIIANSDTGRHLVFDTSKNNMQFKDLISYYIEEEFRWIS